MGFKDFIKKISSGISEEEQEVDVVDNTSDGVIKPTISKISKEGRLRKQLLNIESHRVDYRTLNVFLKVIGTLVVLILLVVLFELIASNILGPVFRFLSLLTPFILGLVFAWLLNPVVTRANKSDLVRRTKASSGGISAIITLLVAIIVLAAILLLGFITLNEIITFLTGGIGLIDVAGGKDLYAEIINYANSDEPKTGSYNIMITLARAAGAINGEKGTYVIGDTLNAFNLDAVPSMFFSFLSKFLVATIVAMYTLPSFSNLGSSFKKIVPKRFKESGGEVIDIMGKSFTSYMRGALLIASILGTIIGIGLFTISILASTFFNVDSGLYVFNSSFEFIIVILVVVTFALICAITNLVPYIGPLIGGTIVVSLTFITDTSPGYWVTFATLGLIVIVQSLESMFLQPVIMGKHTKLHPVIILMGLAIFSGLFGFIGMIVATPIIAVTRSVIAYMNTKYELF